MLQKQQHEQVGLAANQLLMHVPRLPQRLRRGEGVGGGPTGRISWIRRCISTLFDEERIELPWPIALESRQYAERLIQEAVRTELITSDISKISSLEELLEAPWNAHPEIAALLELSAFWLQKPEIVVKLFKVRWYFCFLLTYPVIEKTKAHRNTFIDFYTGNYVNI